MNRARCERYLAAAALQAIGQVVLVEQIYGRVLVPPAMAAELAVEAPSIGAFQVSDFPFLIVRAPTDRAQVVRLLDELHTGEAEALALALETSADTVLIDESLGRRVAARLGLRTIGVLALLVQAKERGLIGHVTPLIDELDSKIHFRASQQVRRRVLEVQEKHEAIPSPSPHPILSHLSTRLSTNPCRLPQ